MAYEERRESISRDAAGDLSAHQYKFMALNSSGQVALNTASGGDCLGVLQNKPAAAGQASTVTTGGVTKVIAGASFNPGVAIMSNATGLAITATTGLKILGVALEAGVNGQVTSVQLDKAGVV